MKFKLAVFVGRFQPFHKGHWWSLQRALEIADQVVIVVGSIQEKGTQDNPWSFEERKVMLEKSLKKLNQVERRRIVGIGGVEDYPQDEDWVETVKQEISRLVGQKIEDWSQVVVVGNNDWTNRTLQEMGGLSVWENGLYKRDLYEGKKIRELKRRGDQAWKERCHI